MPKEQVSAPRVDVKRLEKLAVVINDKLEHHHEHSIGLIDWNTCDQWRKELLSALGWKRKWLRP